MRRLARVSDRLAQAPGADAVRRLVERSDLQPLSRDERAVAVLEVAVRENTRLAAGLEAQVTALEASLVPLLESLEGDAGDDA